MLFDQDLAYDSSDRPAAVIEDLLKKDVLLKASFVEREDIAQASYRMAEESEQANLSVEVARHTSINPFDQNDRVSALSQSIKLNAIGPEINVFSAYFHPYEDPETAINKELINFLRPITLDRFCSFPNDFPSAFELLNEIQENGQIMSSPSRAESLNRTMMFDIVRALRHFPPYATSFTHSVEMNGNTFEVDSTYRSTGEVYRKIRPFGLARDLYPIIKTFNGETEIKKPVDKVLAEKILKKCITIFSHE